MLAPSISNAPQFPATQISVDERARRTPSITDSDREALVKLVDALQAAALNPDAMKKLGSVILEEERNLCGKSLAVLLRPPSESGVDTSCKNRENLLPRKNPMPSSLPAKQAAGSTGVSGSGDPELARERKARMQTASALWAQHIPHVTPPRSLVEYAVDYRNEHPEENERDFIRPFEQLAQRNIRMPDDIALIFTHRILSFDTFRRMVETYVTQLPIPMPKELAPAAAPDGWKDTNYWEHALAALCSSLAMVALEKRTITPEALLDWIGLKERKEALDPNRTTQDKKFPPPAEHSRPITVLLARWHQLDASKDHRSRATSNAALIKDPEKLRLLAKHLVPRVHIAYLLSIADSVDWSVLEQEIDRVAKQHQALNAGMTAEQRTLFYGGSRATFPEHNKRLEESCRNMAPYLLVNRMRADERLDTWIVAKGDDGDRNAGAHLERRPASARFQDWATNKMPVEQQAWMGLFILQGFDETWAKNVVKDHADNPARIRAWFGDALNIDPARVRTWFAQVQSANLDFRLNGAMKAAVARWLADKNINPHMLSLLPAMIQSDMSVAQIDIILDAKLPHFLVRIDEMFGPHANTARKIRYGLVTREQVLDFILNEGIYEYGRGKAEEQKLRELPELSKKAAEARDQVRRMRLALENLGGAMADDTLQARWCERFAHGCEQAVAMLNDVLQPRTDARWAQEYRDINERLNTLVAKLSFREANLTEPAKAGAVGMQQLV